MYPTATPPIVAPGKLGEFINFVKVLGDLLLVGDSSGALTLFDISDPINPRPLSNTHLGTEPVYVVSGFATILPDEVRDAVLQDYRLYVITVTNLMVFDVTDPSAPTELGRIRLTERLNDIEPHGTQLSLLTADTRSDLVLASILDVSDPTAIQVISQAELPGMTVGRARLNGDLAYVTVRDMSSAEDLRLFNIHDPTNPIDLGQVDGLPAFRAWLIGDTAFIATGRIFLSRAVGPVTEVASVAIVDLSHPASPSIVSYIWAEDIASDLSTVDGKVFIIGDHGTRWYDEHLDPVLGWTGPRFWFNVAETEEGASPLVTRTLDLVGTAESMDLFRGYAYIAAGEGGLHIVSAEAAVLMNSLIDDDLKTP